MTGDTGLAAKARLLGELEDLVSTRDKEEATAARRRIWQELAQEDGKASPDEFITELSQELGIPPITVQRWIKGEYGPRTLTLKRLREHFGLAPALAQRRQTGPDAPVPFGGEHSYAALRTIDHFFFALEHAQCCFVFKGKLGFHAARQEKIRSQLVQALKANGNRTVYYIFPEKSEGKTTFHTLKRKVEETDPDVSSQIRAVPVPASNDRLGLGMSLRVRSW